MMKNYNNFVLRCEPYKTNFCNGFSKLQQMQEFVDVTLAAGGRLVGAHQNVLALASPYFRELLKSAPCRHPVIFLGPISHTVLAFLLEYIYTGEVKVPSVILPSFIEASKMLYIVGIEDVQVPQEFIDANATSSQNEPSTQNKDRPVEFPKQSVNDVENEVMSWDNEELQQLSEELTGSKEEVQGDRLIQNEDNIRPAQLVEVRNDRNPLNEEPLHMENIIIIQPSKEHVIQSGNSISSEIEENVIPNKFAACIKIDNESHEVKVDPMINCGDEIFDYDATNEAADKHIHIEDNEIIKDFEDIIPTNVTEINISDAKQNTNIDENVSESDKSSVKAFEFNIPTTSGLLTITNTTDVCKNNGSKSISGNMAVALYMKSMRGNLMMILNRYLYNLHHTSYMGDKRRWRCIEYRGKNCRAFVDTFKEDIVGRKGIHSHYFHDDKVLKLGRARTFQTSIAKALETKFVANDDNVARCNSKPKKKKSRFSEL